MERKEYELGQARQRPMRRGPGGFGGPGGRMGGGEKPKDMIGSWKKLLRYCNRYTVFIIIAVLCAAGGTVLTLLGPGKISDLTKYIQDGL